MRQVLLLGVAIAALASAASAESGDVDEVVVRAARLEETVPQDLARYGADLSVVEEATVRDNVYVDVSQALQMQTPGVFLSPRNGPFSYVDIAVQGSRTSDVLWLVDGVRISNRLYTSTSPADTLPASMVERIEVLKGGQGLFYGTQAVAGAVNVVTRAYAAEFDGRLTVGGDTNGGIHADAYARDTVGRHRYLAWISKDEASGYRTFDIFQPSATERKRGYDVVSFGGKYGVDLADGLVLNLYLQHTDAHLEYPSPRLTRLAFNDRDEEIASVSLDWTAREDVQLSVKGYFHDWDSVYSTVENVPGDPSAVPVIVDDLAYWGFRDYGVNVLARLRGRAGLEYHVGYEFQNFNGRDEVLLIADRTETVHAVVGQVRTTEDLLETARFAAGVRYNKAGGAEKLVWNASGRWDAAERLYVEGSAGSAFILPSAEQLYAVDPYSVAGDPDLRAETSVNLNVSVGGEGEGFAWKVTGFVRKVDNLITDEPSAAYPEGIYVNTDREVRFRGVELIGAAEILEGLSVRASLTYTRAREEGATWQFDRIPQLQAKAGLDWAPTNLPIGASASVLWTGEVFQNVSGFGRVNYGDYAVLDLAVHGWLDGADRRHKLTARLENALDEDYATRVGSAQVDLAPSGVRFLYGFRGVPRTLRLSYAYSF